MPPKHVHYLELDQFVGADFLVTVHGPISPKVPLEAALRETNAVAARMDSGRLHPESAFGLSYAIVSSIARKEADMNRAAHHPCPSPRIHPLTRKNVPISTDIYRRETSSAPTFPRERVAGLRSAVSSPACQLRAAHQSAHADGARLGITSLYLEDD